MASAGLSAWYVVAAAADVGIAELAELAELVGMTSDTFVDSFAGSFVGSFVDTVSGPEARAGGGSGAKPW